MICTTIVISTNPNNALANGNALKTYWIDKNINKYQRVVILIKILKKYQRVVILIKI